MSEITKAEREILMEDVFYSIGGPVRKIIEFDNKSFDVFLRMSIQEYSSFINNWLIENNYVNIQGLSVDSADITLALTTKTLDFETSFAAAYSKQHGVGNTQFSKYELKKDFITVSAHTQVYTIPEGREINEVLWSTPPNIGLSSGGFGGPWSQGLYGWTTGQGIGLQAMLPAYNILLNSQDRKQKSKILQSELTYRVAPGQSGTKLLFLYPIPGSGDEISGQFGRHYEGARVYYFYYETNSRGRKKCLEENNDIVKTPNDVPISKLKYMQLNESSKLRVREILVIKFLEYLAINRGKFTGDILGPNDKNIKLDYQFLQDRADKEKERVYGLIENMLKKLSYAEMMEDRARIAESLNTVLKYQTSRTQFLIK